MVWLATTGWMIATRQRAHVRIRFLQNRLPRPAWRVAEVATQLATASLGAGIAWFGVALVQKNLDLDATSLPISMAWLYAPMIPAGLVTALQGVGEALGYGVARPTSPMGEALVE
jgi:TRAP-type C4-dicarboxylate transport system permease small subunit